MSSGRLGVPWMGTRDARCGLDTLTAIAPHHYEANPMPVQTKGDPERSPLVIVHARKAVFPVVQGTLVLVFA